MSLTARARQLYDNRRMAAQWVLAVRWMRARGLWIYEGGPAKWRGA